ncbi:MAG: hypothetical protein Hyperionvirus2_26 [Hyperionvirus sp.]|uniref:Uncharacterized protein n=1 Tax=Hyperionvirus sp. TaxID=2487770 RepID=A0A3G5A654_9VIRU|nr:MAG: hypothetical protein Hyperionvirus2_26 [Hyperionvirus sp.]
MNATRIELNEPRVIIVISNVSVMGWPESSMNDAIIRGVQHIKNARTKILAFLAILVGRSFVAVVAVR